MGAEVADHVNYVKTSADFEIKFESKKLNKLIVKKLIFA